MEVLAQKGGALQRTAQYFVHCIGSHAYCNIHGSSGTWGIRKLKMGSPSPWLH